MSEQQPQSAQELLQRYEQGRQREAERYEQQQQQLKDKLAQELRETRVSLERRRDAAIARVHELKAEYLEAKAKVNAAKKDKEAKKADWEAAKREVEAQNASLEGYGASLAELGLTLGETVQDLSGPSGAEQNPSEHDQSALGDFFSATSMTMQLAQPVPQTSPAGQPALAAGNSFVRPKKASNAIKIKDANGNVIEFSKPSQSPAPAPSPARQSDSPFIVKSMSTRSPTKTVEERKKDFQEQIKAAPRESEEAKAERQKTGC